MRRCEKRRMDKCPFSAFWQSGFNAIYYPVSIFSSRKRRFESRFLRFGKVLPFPYRKKNFLAPEIRRRDLAMPLLLKAIIYMKRIFIFLIGSLALVSCDKGENWWGKGPKPEPGVFSFNEKDIETLIRNIDECIGECEAFLLQLGISIEDIIAEPIRLTNLNS